ncbi:MAG: hypothetical protein ACM3NJ_00235, partial [Methanobacterium sp.]
SFLDTDEKNEPVSLPRPSLKEELSIIHIENGAEIITEQGSRRKTLCQINQAGQLVLKHMNGKNSVEEISRLAARELNILPQEIQPFSSGIAAFIAALGEACLLKQGYYVNIYRREVVV